MHIIQSNPLSLSMCFIMWCYDPWDYCTALYSTSVTLWMLFIDKIDWACIKIISQFSYIYMKIYIYMWSDLNAIQLLENSQHIIVHKQADPHLHCHVVLPLTCHLPSYISVLKLEGVCVCCLTLYDLWPALSHRSCRRSAVFTRLYEFQERRQHVTFF